MHSNPTFTEFLKNLPRIEQMHLNIMSIYVSERERYNKAIRQMTQLFCLKNPVAHMGCLVGYDESEMSLDQEASNTSLSHPSADTADLVVPLAQASLEMQTGNEGGEGGEGGVDFAAVEGEYYQHEGEYTAMYQGEEGNVYQGQEEKRVGDGYHGHRAEGNLIEGEQNDEHHHNYNTLHNTQPSLSSQDAKPSGEEGTSIEQEYQPQQQLGIEEGGSIVEEFHGYYHGD